MGLFDRLFNKKKPERNLEQISKVIEAEKETDDKFRNLFISLLAYYDKSKLYTDELFVEAARIVVEEQQFSTSLIMRRLHLNNNRALQILEQLKIYSILGPFEDEIPTKVIFNDLMNLEYYLIRIPKTQQQIELFYEQNKEEIEIRKIKFQNEDSTDNDENNKLPNNENKNQNDITNVNKSSIQELKNESYIIEQEQGFNGLLNFLRIEFKLNDLTAKEKTDLIIDLSDYFKKKKKFDNAFRIFSIVSELIVSLDKANFLLNEINILDTQAYICLEEKKYSSYLQYYISSFILEIAKDILMLPDINQFFHKRNISYKNGFPFDNNDDFNDALNNLKILKHKKALLNDIFNYAYKELPIFMGVPEKYLDEEYLESISVSNIDNYVKAIPEKNEIEVKINSKPNIEHALASRFSGKVVKKYYDLER